MKPSKTIRKLTFILAFFLAASPSLAEVRVVVVGATPNMKLVQRWANLEDAAVTTTPGFQSFHIDESDISVTALSATASLSSVANALYAADVAMIVMNATDGPVPSIREHVIVSRQAGVPLITIMMANVDEMFSVMRNEAPELFDLEVEELRNVLALCEVGGPDTPVFHDSEASSHASRSSDGGLGDIGSYILYLAPSRGNPPSLKSTRNARAQAYFQTDAEANGFGIRRAPQHKLVMWCEGASAIVEIVSTEAYGSGELGAVFIRTPQSFAAVEGSRILLLNDGHVVGLGVISKLGRSQL